MPKLPGAVSFADWWQLLIKRAKEIGHDVTEWEPESWRPRHGQGLHPDAAIAEGPVKETPDDNPGTV